MLLRPATAADHDALTLLVHTSLRAWYLRKLNMDKFGEDPEIMRGLVDTYELLDPGCCVVAEEPGTGRLLGSVFYHPRETHWGIGVVTTHPDAGGRGVARALMEHVLQLARDAGKLPRLVSSAMNLDSFSLYTRLGFVPQMTFQDMRLDVPAAGLPPRASPVQIRPAQPADVPRIADFEHTLNGIRREKDYAFFTENRQGVWHLMIAETEGRLTGFLGANTAAGMAGPGVAADEETMMALLHQMLDSAFRGRQAVWLAPVHCGRLVRECYALGARNIEMHLASACGHAAPMTGVTLPTFMPESG